MDGVTMKTLLAHKTNYGQKRSRDIVDYIVIHYTAGNGDTAENEAKYFHNNANLKASAHFFVGQDGHIIKSVPLNYVAWSVGGKLYNDTAKTGGGRLYKACTNLNSVSIELCDNLKKDPSEAQIKAVKKLIKYIHRYCKNTYSAACIIRHFDVNGKHCPARMMDNTKWNKFKARII